MTEKPVLVFISTRFLFPADSGGKIRTTQILRGLKGGAYFVRLLMPCTIDSRDLYLGEIEAICDELVCWPLRAQSKVGKRLANAVNLLRALPVPVLADQCTDANRVIEDQLRRAPAVVVFDFPHAAILAPRRIPCPSVMFTHNIEAEIFRRHLEVARSPIHRWLWRNQYRKMLRFEKSVLRSFDTTIGVSERDCHFFCSEYGVDGCRPIPTGVDTEFFAYRPPSGDGRVVFCGSMDWMANIDGIEWFFDAVWPGIRRRIPSATMKVVGRAPPPALVSRITLQAPEWSFTGFVEDVRPHLSGADVFVIPLRVGGGTRIKAFEAMAMGTPVVSTSIGTEGLPVIEGEHYLASDTADDFSGCVASLLQDHQQRLQISQCARDFVESRFGYQVAATEFERICKDTVQNYSENRKLADDL